MSRIYRSLMLALALVGGGTSSRATAQTQFPPTSVPKASSPKEIDPATLDALLKIFQEATITQLDAKISLESLSVQNGRVKLRGLRLHDLKLGVRLSSQGATQLAEWMRGQMGANSPLEAVLQIVRLGLFNRIEIGFSLGDLEVRALDLDSDQLRIEDALVAAGVESSPTPFKPSDTTLAKFLSVVQSAAFNRASLQAGLGHLAAKRVKIRIEGLGLDNLHVGLGLNRS